DADVEEVDLLAILAEALRHLLVAHLHAVDDERSHPAVDQILPDLRLELAPIALRREHALEQVAIEGAVALQLGHGGDGVEAVLLAEVEPEPVGLVAQQGVVDQLIERLPAQHARLRHIRALQQLLEAVLERLGLDVEIAARDALAVDARDDVEMRLARGADAPPDEG